MNNLTDLQAAYLCHYRRFKALGFTPISLADLYVICFERADQIEVPVFIKGMK